MTEGKETKPSGEKSTTKESLAKVRETFGTLIANEGVSVVLHKEYRGHGDRFVINTTSIGVRGPKTGSATGDEAEDGSAFIDIAITPEDAKRLRDQLDQQLKEYEGGDN